MKQTISTTEDIERDAQRLHELMIALSHSRPLWDPTAICDRVHLTYPQVHTLLHLGHEGSLPIGMLAKRIGVSVKTITGIVDRLERDGFLERHRGATDRRIVQVRLTQKGSRTHRVIDAAVHERIREFLALFTSADRRDLLRILTALLDRLCLTSPDLNRSVHG